LRKPRCIPCRIRVYAQFSCTSNRQFRSRCNFLHNRAL
jgi:hypothetical protein